MKPDLHHALFDEHLRGRRLFSEFKELSLLYMLQLELHSPIVNLCNTTCMLAFPAWALLAPPSSLLGTDGFSGDSHLHGM